MKEFDGLILPGGKISYSNNVDSKNEKLIPLKVIHNKYNNKKVIKTKREFLKPNKNENLKEFSKRVDIESKKYLIEKDREMFRIHKSIKSKVKREKRINRKLKRMEIKNNEFMNNNIESSEELLNNNKPSFGDVIDSPPNFSSKIKDKLEKSRKDNINKKCNDLDDYIKQVRKAYSEVKEKRISEKNKFLENKKFNKERIFNNFDEGWIGIGKFKND